MCCWDFRRRWGCNRSRCFRREEHGPEKWEPVFGKRSCSNKVLERDDDSKKNHRALASAAVAPPLIFGQSPGAVEGRTALCRARVDEQIRFRPRFGGA